jgi:hypothetical protein
MFLESRSLKQLRWQCKLLSFAVKIWAAADEQMLIADASKCASGARADPDVVAYSLGCRPGAGRPVLGQGAGSAADSSPILV